MLFILGVFLICVGGFQTLMTLSKLGSMGEFERYLIGDKLNGSLGIWAIVLVIGIGITWFSYSKRKKQESEALLNNLKHQSTSKCSNCGLDVAPNTTICPQCNHQIGGTKNV